MTIFREPGTLPHAVHLIATSFNESGRSGYDIVAKHMGLSASLLRKWSNPNRPELPSIAQGQMLDVLYVTHGCGTPPIHAIHEARLEAAVKPPHAPSCPMDRLHDVMTEVGQVPPVLMPALLASNPTPQQIRQARKEVSEAVSALQKADADLVALTAREVS